MQTARYELGILDHYRPWQETCPDGDLRRLFRQWTGTRCGHLQKTLDWLNRRSADVIDPDIPHSPPPPIVPGQVTAESGQRRLPIIEYRPISNHLVIFKIPRPADFHFIPGQYVKLRLGETERSYSLVSAPHQPFLEFFIERVPGGAMSAQLGDLAMGDFIELGDQAKGKFTLDTGFANHFMVATVTGVNPFVSILRSYLHEKRQAHRFFLLQGASFQDEFGYREELERLAAAHPDILTYIATVSRPADPGNATWTGERGRVDTLADHYLSQFELEPATTMVYACGNPGMVDAIENRFLPQGFKVEVERYD